jgi:hypothetical protein
MAADEELDDLRLDIEVLLALIDAALDRGITGKDPVLRAVASTLQQRRHRLQQLTGEDQPTTP